MQEAIRGFETTFERKAEAVGIAPGRVEILGNHTDYNEGFILGAAIDRYTYVACARSNKKTCRVASSAMEGSPVSFDVYGEKSIAWVSYVQGVLQLWLNNEDVALDVFVYSTIPLGSGVSSSAALELAVAKALEIVVPRAGMTPLKIAQLCKKAENDFVGMGCGILDQFTSSFGQESHVIFLDCRDLSSHTCQWDEHHVFVLLNTKAPHQLVDGAYMTRREACFSTAQKCGVPFLRDLDEARLESAKDELDENEYKRAKHIVGENKRVHEGVTALLDNDFRAFGALLSQSHASSRDFFDNSWKEADQALEAAKTIPGFLGGRMMGGGFGGCTLNLVDLSDTSVEAFTSALEKAYLAATGLLGSCFVARPSRGAYNERVV